MRRTRSHNSKAEPQSAALKGWHDIARFLSQPISVAQRWAKSGMPVERKGRYVHASAEELNRWLGRESAGEPVHIVTKSTDLNSELRRGLSYVRQHRRARKAN